MQLNGCHMVEATNRLRKIIQLKEATMPSTSTDYLTTVRVNAPAEVVFDRVTSAEALAAWWSPVTGSGRTGGELRFPMVADQPPLLVRVDEATFTPAAYAL